MALRRWCTGSGPIISNFSTSRGRFADLKCMEFPLRAIGCDVRLICMLGLVLAACGCQSGAHVVQSTEDFPVNRGFLQTQITVNGEDRTVWVFIPRDYNPRVPAPAILFLHGLFEAGNGGHKVLKAGLGPVVADYADVWPFITIFPQSPGKWEGEEAARLAIGALDFAQQQWNIDRDRVILAGFSYGGLGTWEIGARYSDRFAALVPVSGHSALDSVDRLTNIPIWAFAFTGDPWVRSSNSMQMCMALQSRGAPVRLTEFEGAGHDCWPLAVTESELVRWMLKQRRSAMAQQQQAQARSLVLPIRASAQ